MYINFNLGQSMLQQRNVSAERTPNLNFHGGRKRIRHQGVELATCVLYFSSSKIVR